MATAVVDSSSDQPGGQKRQRTDLDALGVRAARMQFEQGLDATTIAARLGDEGQDIRSARDVRLLIKRVIDKRLVGLRVDVHGSESPTTAELGRSLAKAAGIRRAVIADSAGFVAQGNYVGDDATDQQEALDESSALHRELGRAAASFIWNALRPGDTVGIGAGRGVAFTVDALESYVPDATRFEEYEIFSLAGGMMRMAWNRRVEDVDADHNATRLAAILGARDENWLKLHQVRLPIFLSRDKEATVRSRASHLMDVETYDPFDLALFGCGVVNQQHHLLCSPSPETLAISEELDILRSKLLASGYDSAVIDVCDRFWPCQVPDDLRSLVGELIASLNSKVVTIAPERLSQARERVCVAGGAQKYDALLCLLRFEGVRPTTLVTDECTAIKLIRDLEH